MRKVFATLVALVVFGSFTITAQAQDLMYGQREMQVSYNGNSDYPVVVFNGSDFSSFYLWSGSEDKNSGLHMRRIGLDGKAFGPQRLIIPITTDIIDSSIAAVWDGSAYVVFVAPGDNSFWHAVRVDTKGNVLGYKKVAIPAGEEVFWRYVSFVIGDRAYLFFSTTDNGYLDDGYPYLLTADSELNEKPTLVKLPTAGLRKPKILGVALDPDKLLVYMGQYSEAFFESEIDKAVLLHINFAGKRTKTITPAVVTSRGSGPAEKLQTLDLSEASGPVYTGDGYILIGSQESDFPFVLAPAQSFPFQNSAVKIDDSGQIVDGPFNLGNGDFRLYLGKPILLGSYLAVPFSDLVAEDTQMMILGKKGRHVKDLPVHESRSFFGPLEPEIVDAAYSGTQSVITYFGFKDRINFFAPQWIIYSNVVTSPKFVKPAIVYFQASEGSPFGDDRRLVMWSAASCTDVTLTGPDFEMTNLPPVFHTVIDTNGERTVLRLSISGTDGSTKTKRIVIEPLTEI